ncbi:SET methyltransferase domain containing protein [Nitzschia inconspicua]|uniref:SET methyltransferase domain containing protein n=1 Tax=Nitzschia inconspicua TaxID=303405 RepID=A0A9K3KC41_9STRA|nr:SET methyltransferase domain containing protein [Nitzschia inconspicua]
MPDLSFRHLCCLTAAILLILSSSTATTDVPVCEATDAPEICMAKATAAKVRQKGSTSTPTASKQDKESHPPECSLYFAPSTIPNAGWGIFTAKDLKRDELLGGSLEAAADLILPIMDSYKTYPYRGNQRFLPWLAYVWPSKSGEFYGSTKRAFPEIEAGQFKVDEGLSNAGDLIRFYDMTEYGKPKLPRINAITPGLALQMNSHEEWDNVFFEYDHEKGHSYGQVFMVEDQLGIDYHDDDEEDDESGFNGNHFSHERRSWYSHKGLGALRDIEAGSELFLHYGDKYHKHLEKQRTTAKDFLTLDDYMEVLDFSQLNTEFDKRWLLNTTSMTLRNDENASFAVREPKLGAKFRTVEEHTEPPDYGTDPPKRDLKWLQEHGVCVDQLFAAESGIEEAGKGAFAKYGFSKGEVVSHAPLLHLKRDDMNIYKVIEEIKPDQEEATERLDFDTIEAKELMINYCFGHKDSEILLFPYSPMVNYINHDGENPNTAIRWTNGSKEYFAMHPIDVLEQHGGTLRMEYVALRDIAPEEEITIDYGPEWAEAWKKYQVARMQGNEVSFRHEIRVPDGFYPDNWLNKSVTYELAPNKDLEAGELQPLVWKHNGKPFTRFAHRVGLPKGISKRFLEYSTDIGVIPTYSKLLKNRILGSDEWYVWNATTNSTGENAGQWFAQRYKSDVWHFNMHYISAWDETARRNFLGEVGRAGFDDVLDGIGNYFGLDNMTCFHLSYMGVSECEKSFTHTDVYATGDVSYNMIWPLQLVEGSKPELNLQSDDANIVVAYKYEYDTAVLMGDWGYHYTSAIDGYTGDEMRVVVGMYCGQMDKRNAKMYAHLYDGEDPAPFMGQFEEPFEYHWSKGNPPKHRMSRL